MTWDGPKGNLSWELVPGIWGTKLETAKHSRAHCGTLEKELTTGISLMGIY